LEIPEGVSAPNVGTPVCKLHKSLYGLKQSPRCWNGRIHSFLTSLGFQALKTDSALYVKRAEEVKIIVAIYVDDILILSKNVGAITNVKVALSTEFTMTDAGEVDVILGIKIIRNKESGLLMMSQEHYANQVLERFNMQMSEGKNLPLPPGTKMTSHLSPVSESERNQMSSCPYREAVGSLMYLMISTRPDLASAVQLVSRFSSNPGLAHWNLVKNILRYVQKTKSFCLTFVRQGEIKLTGYCDADWESCVDSRRSTSGYVFILGGGAISWSSRRQKSVSLSTCEAEYVAACEATREAIWERAFLEELSYPQLDPTLIYCDSQSALQLIQNPVFHDKTKHIQGKMHFVRERAQDGDVRFEKIHTTKNVADMLTKGVNMEKLNFCRTSLGLY
jgi:Reverse transcriptase (RNA-dependent DNA polymerase)